MANRALLSRSPSTSLLRLHLEVSRCHRDQNDSFIISLLAKARSLDLHHLTVKDLWLSRFLLIIPIIFTIKSLRCLSLNCSLNPAICFPSGITLTFLRSLCLILISADTAKLNQLLSELCSSEDLHLSIRRTPGISLSSQTIRKLKLIIGFAYTKHYSVGLSLPSLDSLHLEIQDSLESLSHINGKFPLLRKAVIKLYYCHERNVTVVSGLLNCISNAEELSLHLKDRKNLKYPIPILFELGKDVPEFLELEHLDLCLCFHGHNLKAVPTMLHNCPSQKSLKLVHEIIPMFTGFARRRKRKAWRSRLSLNADGNYRYAYFQNLHLEENRKAVIRLLSKKCSSKK